VILRNASLLYLWRPFALLGLLHVASSLAQAQGAPSDDPLILERMGVAYVGGERVPVGAGSGSQTYWTGQMRVTYVVPPNADEAPPIVMLPGHGLDASLWLTTPDGREGWAQAFARGGYAAWAVDPAEIDRSGIDPRPFEAVRSGTAPPSTQPSLFRWANEAVWARWGLGPSYGTPFADTRFPAAHADAFLKSMATVVSGGAVAEPPALGEEPGATPSSGSRRGGARGDAGQRDGADPGVAAAAPDPAWTALLEEIGPAVIVAHSMAGQDAFAFVRARPDLVAALVVVEPVGCPGASPPAAMLGVPFYYVFGDHFEDRNMQGRFDACLATAQALREGGGTAEGLWLPAEGIFGNTHLLMVDDNNAEIAARSMAWLGEIFELR
jgi:pimeloyl-ACP methyl ester carboxylesterase